MAKGKIFWGAAAAAAVSAGYLMKNPDQRAKLTGAAKQQWAKLTGQEGEEVPLEERIGHPNPMDIDDNEMVAEGSTYAVDYYNQEHAEDGQPGSLDNEQVQRHH
ncbi:hypothetical protein [Natribacillus halophilus]|uniref:Uncharacterized protein n=1 Tax=Natribacillus halophilus TaxID=549003 RepID=A0A1G8LIB0_9BACI|nr:hypothetical protein [Natribacillus halophilus]SDI55406.1 hypothetical protein SAMN04488123_103106 [Natribacillus halophilus]